MLAHHAVVGGLTMVMNIMIHMFSIITLLRMLAGCHKGRMTSQSCALTLECLCLLQGRFGTSPAV